MKSSYLASVIAILLASFGITLIVSPKIRFVTLVAIFGYGDDHKPPKAGEYRISDALSDTDLILFHIDDKDYKPSPEKLNWNIAMLACSNAKIRPEATRIVIGIYNLHSGTYEDAIEFSRSDYLKGNTSAPKYYFRLLRSNNMKNGFDWAF